MSQGRPPAPVFRPPQPQHWQGGHGQQETLEVPGGVLSSESGFEESSVFGLRRPVVHHGAGLEPLNDPGVQMSDKQLGHASNDSTVALPAGRLCRPICVASVTTKPLSVRWPRPPGRVTMPSSLLRSWQGSGIVFERDGILRMVTLVVSSAVFRQGFFRRIVR